MGEHQITDLLNISMDNIKDMLKVDLIVGDPINVGKGFLIPIARVKCGFVSGGMNQKIKNIDLKDLPFGGATGGSITLTPIAFVSVAEDDVKILHLEESTHVLEKTIDSVTDLLFSTIGKKNRNAQDKL